MSKELKNNMEMSDKELMEMMGGFSGETVIIEPQIPIPAYGILPKAHIQPLYGIKPKRLSNKKLSIEVFNC